MLFDVRLSGHCHRVRLFLSLLGVAYESRSVDLAGGQHRRPEFLRLNPWGQVPYLVHGTTGIADSNAILVYLAKTLGARDWLPDDPEGAAAVQRWLSMAAGELAYGPAAARRARVFRKEEPAASVVESSRRFLAFLDAHLAGSTFLVGVSPTIADLAHYTYVARVPEGGIPLGPYPHVRAWLERIEGLPGFEPMPLAAGGPA